MPRAPVIERVITVLADWFNEQAEGLPEEWAELYQDAAGILLDVLAFWHTGELPDEFESQ